MIDAGDGSTQAQVEAALEALWNIGATKRDYGIISLTRFDAAQSLMLQTAIVRDRRVFIDLDPTLHEISRLVGNLEEHGMLALPELHQLIHDCENARRRFQKEVPFVSEDVEAGLDRLIELLRKLDRPDVLELYFERPVTITTQVEKIKTKIEELHRHKRALARRAPNVIQFLNDDIPASIWADICRHLPEELPPRKNQRRLVEILVQIVGQTRAVKATVAFYELGRDVLCRDYA